MWVVGTTYLSLLYHIFTVISTSKQKSTSLAGGFAFSGIALILLATHKCVENWPASHAIITLCHKWLCRLHRWRELSVSMVLEPRNEVRGSRELTEGAFLLYSFCLVSFFGGVNSFHRKRSPSLSDGGLVPLIFLHQINFYSSVKPLLNHATIAWFSLYNKKRLARGEPFVMLILKLDFSEVLDCTNHLACVGVLVIVPRNNLYLICVVVNLSNHCLSSIEE